MTTDSSAFTVFSSLLFLSVPLYAEEGSWTDRVNFNGDFRLRYEAIDEEGFEQRDRMRFRARFGFKVDIRDDIEVVMQLATGGGDPVSTNQTFDDGFSTKDIGLDLAYVDWRISDSLSINVGKMKNPLFRAGRVPLVWDSDLHPEGIAARFSSGVLFGTVAGFSVEERSSADDSLLFATQVGLKFSVGEAASLTAGIGYFGYSNTIGNEPFYDGGAKGNTVDNNGDYGFEYKNIELFAQLDTAVGGWPLQIFGHYTRNSEVGREDTAYAFGATMGAARQPREMEFAWMYQDIEADALIATFNDSDFGGGGTDARGHILKARYAYSDNIFFAGTLFVNMIEGFQSIEHDYNRIQLDVEFNFD